VTTAQYNLPNLIFCHALIYQKRHHIGVAMDSPRGLVVAVVRVCQDKSLTDIALYVH